MATNDDDDRKLTAYLDGELDEGERAALDARLEADPNSARAARRLTRGGGPHAGGLRGAARDGAARHDEERLDAALAAAPARAAPFWSRRAAAIAAAVAIIAFAGGLGVGRWSAGSGDDLGEHEDWRQAVVEYMALYTPESFGEAASPRLGEEIAMLSRRLDAPLDVDRLKVDDLSPRRAELLQYEGAPLGQIGYLDGATPVAFCITRDGEPDAPLATSSRDGFAVASWAQGGAATC